jgi:FkbM family methyltransferase
MKVRVTGSLFTFFLKLMKHFSTRLVLSNFATKMLTTVFQHMSRDISLKMAQDDNKVWLGFLYHMKSKSFSQMSQDLWVLYRTTLRTKGFFVEVGSCHPINLNNTFLLESTYSWDGILIEPNPHMANLLRTNRKSLVFERAIAAGETIPLHIAQNPEFSSTESQLSKETHKLHKPTGEVVLVKSSTLTDLLTKADCPSKFDFLSLDIEGGELFALESLDLNRFRPLLISVEHNFSSSRELIAEYLINQNYVLDPLSAKSSWDDWYIDKEYLQSILKAAF